MRTLNGCSHAMEFYATLAPPLVTWLEKHIDDGVTVYGFIAAEDRLLRTTNGLERVNRELKCCTRVVGIFPNVASCLRLVSAVAMEISDEWEAGRNYPPLRSPRTAHRMALERIERVLHNPNIHLQV